MTEKRFRVVALVEGLSFLLLFFVAMPARAITGERWPVTIAGGIHGGLFLLYIGCLLAFAIRARLGLLGIVLGTVLGSLPFGWLLFDRWLDRRANQASGSSGTRA